jgi:Alkylmercury lyase
MSLHSSSLTEVLSFGSVLPEGIDAVARGGIAASQAKLPAALRRLHQALLREFLLVARPPTVERIRQLALAFSVDPAEGIAQLADADLVHLDPAGERVQVAYPLSAGQSGHRVTLAGRPTLNAMCAIDALGIPLMARAPGTVVSADPRSGAEIRITMAGSGQWTWQPATAVVLLAASEGSGPIAAACQHTAFHDSRESAESVLAEHAGRTARVLTQAQAVAIAKTEFGPLLQ